MNPWKRIDDTDVYDGFPISSYRIEQFLYEFSDFQYARWSGNAGRLVVSKMPANKRPI